MKVQVLIYFQVQTFCIDNGKTVILKFCVIEVEIDLHNL